MGNANAIQKFGDKEVLVQKQIGEGGNAEILLCKSTKGKSLYALKRMSVNRADREKHLIALWEYELNRKLPKHPYLVRCEGARTVKNPNGDTEYLLLLEYCPNGTLLDWINNTSKPSLKDILKYFAEVCASVAVLHAHNPPIAHRDLKPENVLKNEKGSFKLCDFGSSTTDSYICRTAGERVEVQKLLDKNTTPSYRSPEMCDLYKAAPINEASDIWALGVIFYQMLFRTQPFADGPLAIVGGKYRIPEKHDWSKEVLDLLASMLCVDVNARAKIVDVQLTIGTMLKKDPIIASTWSMGLTTASLGTSLVKKIERPAHLSIKSSPTNSTTDSQRINSPVQGSPSPAPPSPSPASIAPPSPPSQPSASPNVEVEPISDDSHNPSDEGNLLSPSPGNPLSPSPVYSEVSSNLLSPLNSPTEYSSLSPGDSTASASARLMMGIHPPPPPSSGRSRASRLTTSTPTSASSAKKSKKDGKDKDKPKKSKREKKPHNAQDLLSPQSAIAEQDSWDADFESNDPFSPSESSVDSSISSPVPLPTSPQAPARPPRPPRSFSSEVVSALRRKTGSISSHNKTVDEAASLNAPESHESEDEENAASQQQPNEQDERNDLNTIPVIITTPAASEWTNLDEESQCFEPSNNVSQSDSHNEFQPLHADADPFASSPTSQADLMDNGDRELSHSTAFTNTTSSLPQICSNVFDDDDLPIPEPQPTPISYAQIDSASASMPDTYTPASQLHSHSQDLYPSPDSYHVNSNMPPLINTSSMYLNPPQPLYTSGQEFSHLDFSVGSEPANYHPQPSTNNGNMHESNQQQYYTHPNIQIPAATPTVAGILNAGISSIPALDARESDYLQFRYLHQNSANDEFLLISPRDVLMHDPSLRLSAIDDFVAKLTKRDNVTPRWKYCRQLIVNSWVHASDDAEEPGEDDREKEADMSSAQGWVGLPKLFKLLSARPAMIHPIVAHKSLILLHRLLQYGSPAIVGQLFVNRQWMLALQTSFANNPATATPIDDSVPVHDLIVPYSKYIMRRIYLIYQYRQFEGNFSLGYYLNRLLKHEGWPHNWSLPTSVTRDQVAALLQCMHDALSLSTLILNRRTELKSILSPESTSLRELILVPLFDDLISMWLTSTFLLTQLCLSMSVSCYPPGQKATTPNKNTPRSSANENGGNNRIDDSSDDINSDEYNLQTPNGKSEASKMTDDEILNSLSALIASHRTMTDNLHIFFATALQSSTVSHLRRLPSLPGRVNPFQPTPSLHYPPPSHIPGLAYENPALCYRFQAQSVFLAATKARNYIVVDDDLAIHQSMIEQESSKHISQATDFDSTPGQVEESSNENDTQYNPFLSPEAMQSHTFSFPAPATQFLTSVSDFSSSHAQSTISPPDDNPFNQPEDGDDNPFNDNDNDNITNGSVTPFDEDNPFLH